MRESKVESQRLKVEQKGLNDGSGVCREDCQKAGRGRSQMKSTPIRDKLLALFKNESCWCQGHLAKDKKGRLVGRYSEEAHSWCLLGGILMIAKEDTRLILDKFECAVPDWNDHPDKECSYGCSH